MKKLINLFKNNPFYILIFLVFLIFITVYILINKKKPDLLKHKEDVEISENDYQDESKNKIEQIIKEEKESKIKEKSITKEKKDKNLKKNKLVKSKEKIDEKKNKTRILSPRDTIIELHKGLKKINNKNLSTYQITLENVKQSYDSEKMLSMIIGSLWNRIENGKKKQTINIFEEYIAKNYVRRFSKMKNFSFVENKEQNVAKFVMVKSNLIIGKEQKISISYLLSKKKNKWKIFDVLIAGSVSEIATKKSEFKSLIEGENLDLLIDALKKKNKDLI